MREHPLPRRTFSALLGAGALVAAGLAAGLPAASAAPNPTGADHARHPIRTCRAVLARGEANCDAMVMVNSKGAYPQRPLPRRPP